MCLRRVPFQARMNRPEKTAMVIRQPFRIPMRLLEPCLTMLAHLMALGVRMSLCPLPTKRLSCNLTMSLPSRQRMVLPL